MTNPTGDALCAFHEGIIEEIRDRLMVDDSEPKWKIMGDSTFRGTSYLSSDQKEIKHHD